MRESGEKMKNAGELKASPKKFIAEVIASLYRLRLIYAQNKGKLQKNQDRKVFEGIKWEETKNCNKNMIASKTGEQWLHET